MPTWTSTRQPSESAGDGRSQFGRYYPWLLVGMLWWISFFNYADRQAIYSVFPLLKQEMKGANGEELTNTELGLLGSSFAWMYGLGAPFAGIIVDRVRRKAAILGGLHVWSFVCVATGFTKTFPQLVFFRAAEGLGETFYYPASVSLLSDYHGKSTRSRALGFHQTSVYVGTIGGGFFAALLAEHFGWRSSFFVFGGLGVLLGVVLHRFIIEVPRGTADREEKSSEEPAPGAERLPLVEVLRIIATTPTVLALMLAFMCANFVAMVLLTWMPAYLKGHFELSLTMAGLAATVFAQLASMAGSPLGGWLADWLRRRTVRGRMLVQVLGVLGGAPFVFLCGQTQSVGWLLFALTAWGLFKGIYDANIFAAVFDVVRPEARGTTAGFMNMTGWLAGGASAPLVIGYLADTHGLGWAISSAALVYLAAAFFLLLGAWAVTSRPRVTS
jgi:MFS family permease